MRDINEDGKLWNFGISHNKEITKVLYVMVLRSSNSQVSQVSRIYLYLY